MTHTPVAPVGSVPMSSETPTHPRPRSAGDIGTRLAGAGALTFAVTVVLQNLIRGASAPQMDASAHEVLTHYAGHDATAYVLAATYVISGLGMAAFLGGAARRLLGSGRPAWALTGIVGAISVMTLFAVVIGAEQAVGVVAHQAHADSGAVEALWAIHNSVFTVLDFSIAVALLGLSRAGIAAGLTPRVFGRLAPVGTALLLVGTLTGPATAAGDTIGFFAITVVGFLVWLAFLISTGLRMMRTEEVMSPATTEVGATVAAVFEHLERAWNRADGAAFGEVFTEDCDFVDIRGDHHRGRATVAGGHQALFDSIYRGSTISYQVEVDREVAPGHVVVASATLAAPTGPAQGVGHSRLTALLVEGAAGWRVACFHNALVPERP